MSDRIRAVSVAEFITVRFQRNTLRNMAKFLRVSVAEFITVRFQQVQCCISRCRPCVSVAEFITVRFQRVAEIFAEYLDKFQ